MHIYPLQLKINQEACPLSILMFALYQDTYLCTASALLSEHTENYVTIFYTFDMPLETCSVSLPDNVRISLLILLEEMYLKVRFLWLFWCHWPWRVVLDVSGLWSSWWDFCLDDGKIFKMSSSVYSAAFQTKEKISTTTNPRTLKGMEVIQGE